MEGIVSMLLDHTYVTHKAWHEAMQAAVWGAASFAARAFPRVEVDRVCVSVSLELTNRLKHEILGHVDYELSCKWKATYTIGGVHRVREGREIPQMISDFLFR
jgi:hypothetical protein